MVEMNIYLRKDLGICKKKIVKMRKSRSIEPGREVIIIDLDDYLAFNMLIESIRKENRDERLEKVFDCLKKETNPQSITELFYELGLKSSIEKRKAKFYEKYD
jgi:hypothetical protein